MAFGGSAVSGLDSIAEDDVMQCGELHQLLPVDYHKDQILDHIKKYRVTFIQGGTGSGKSTRVPQYILEEYQQAKQAKPYYDEEKPSIVVTQPRRIGAKSLAKRVSKEVGEPSVGGKVGYKIGQEQVAGPDTEICYVTAGYLIELLVHNPKSFNHFTHVILDEIHERDLDADLLSLIVKLLMDRPENKCKVIVMSATLQVELFIDYFSEEGRQLCQEDDAVKRDQLIQIGTQSNFTVDTVYLEELRGFCVREGVAIPENMDNLINDTCEYFMALNSENPFEEKSKDKVNTIDEYINLAILVIQATAIPSGSILVFLPGIHEIEVLQNKLSSMEESLVEGWNSKLSVYPLHSKIPFEDQQQCFTPPEDTCHVILATNMAESSVTLPNVSVVLDFGQRRHLVYDHSKRISVLKLNWCSQASLDQRKGRTGRVCNGRCFRMMTKEHFDNQPRFDLAQMKMAPLDQLILKVKYVGDCISPEEPPSDLLAQAVEPPDTDSIDMAVKNLSDMGALSGNDENAEVTLLGKFCMLVPLDLYLCRLIFFGMLFDCPCDSIVMAASLQSQDPFKQPSNKVFKDTKRFVERQRKSFDSRRKFDDGTYSEPIMYRNMFRKWCLQASEDQKNAEDFVIQRKSKKDVRKMRERFGRQNEVDAKRLELLEGVVSDVCEAVVKWYETISPQHSNINQLLNLLPRTRAVKSSSQHSEQWEKMADDKVSVHHLFSDDHMMLYMMLTGAFMPRYLVGEVTTQSLSLLAEMEGNRFEPRSSIKVPNVPEAVTNSEKVTRKLILDLSLQYDIDPLKSREQGDKFIYLANQETLFVEFISPSNNSKDYGDRNVTSEVHPFVQNAFQFTESPGGRDKRFNYKIQQSAAASCGLSTGNLRLGMVQNPYRLEWQLLSADGSPLDEAHVGYERWRNPGGFVCDVKALQHYGVGYEATFTEKGNRCWMQGITLLPTFQQNLFALSAMLTFLPQQHGAQFRIQTDKMAITEVHLFKRCMTIYRNNPMTKKIMSSINEIRSLTSHIFGNKEWSKKSKFPYLQTLVNPYKALMLCLTLGSSQFQSQSEISGDFSGTTLDDVETVNGFYRFGERRERKKAVYLERYNVDVLFDMESLEHYVTRCRFDDDDMA